MGNSDKQTVAEDQNGSAVENYTVENQGSKTQVNENKAAENQNEPSAKGQTQEDQEAAEEQEALLKELSFEGLPPINLGALFMPPIWGPAHGIWITILYYPAWLFIDNLFYSVYTNPQPLTIVLAIIAGLILAGVTIVFARVSQMFAFHRDLKNGKTKEQYRKRQVKWAVAMAILAAVMLALATYYNLVIRPTMGA